MMRLDYYLIIFILFSMAFIFLVGAFFIRKNEKALVFSEQDESVDFGKILEKLNQKLKNDNIDELLERSRYKQSLERIYFMQIFLALTLGLFSFYIFNKVAPILNILAIGAVILGFYIPILGLKEEIKKRKKQAEEEAPMFCEFLASSLEQGQNYLQALRNLTEKREGVIYSEFTEAIYAIDFNTPPTIALKNVAEIFNSERIKNIINIIITSKETSTAMAVPLRGEAERLRTELKKEHKIIIDGINGKVVYFSLFMVIIMCIGFFVASGPQMAKMFGM